MKTVVYCGPVVGPKVLWESFEAPENFIPAAGEGNGAGVPHHQPHTADERGGMLDNKPGGSNIPKGPLCPGTESAQGDFASEVEVIGVGEVEMGAASMGHDVLERRACTAAAANGRVGGGGGGGGGRFSGVFVVWSGIIENSFEEG